ncbi:ABC transporter substrate-binding protein [Cellulomonas sp. KRMCY2]|uniref:ABC transporter substrate-binding protein n=1 Tax=Cellulomonas sp. KRMCY2 TaxID=1304865 RepID=UPI00045EC1A7|nr:ABC transporter substrate-binding protein [Cellulomonas sp. KRMCY2]
MKRYLTGAAAVATITLLMTACSDPSVDTPDAPADAGSGTASDEWPEPTADLTGVELTIWAAQNSNTVPEAVVAQFEEATGASVEVVTIPDPYEQGIQTKVATGDTPDLAFWQPTASMLTALNAPTNLQSLDGAPWIEDLSPALQDITGILDGTRYAALITSPAVEGVYYNKQVFEANGIADLPADWESFIDTARTLDAAGQTPFFEMAGDRWATQWWVQVQLADAAKDGLWDRVNTGEEKFTDETILGAIETYKALVDEGLFNEDLATATFEDQGDALLNGEAAMVVQVNSFFSQLQAKADTAELDEKIGFFPISPEGNTGTFIPDQSNALVAFKTGDQQREAAARQLLAFWMGAAYPAFVEDRATISLEDSVESPDNVPQALLDIHASLEDSVGSMQALAVANPDLYIYLADMIQGSATPEQVARQTQDQFVQLARAQGVEGF